MAIRIPVYEDRLTPRAEQQIQARAPQVDQSLGRSMEGLGNAGMTMAAVEAGRQKQEEDQRATLEAAQSASRETVYRQNFLQDMANKSQDGTITAEDGQRYRFSDFVNRHFMARDADLVGAVQNPKAKLYMQQHLISMQTTMMGMAGKLERQGQEAAALGGMEEVVRNSATAVMGGLDPATAQTQADRLIANLPIDPAAKVRLSLHTRDRLSEAAMERALLNNPQGVLSATQARISGGAQGDGSDAGELIAMAQRNGWSPHDLAMIMGYESGMSPAKRGGKDNAHIGLIQFGAAEQAKYGAHQGQSFQEQLKAVEAYLKDRGAQPGDGIDTLYRVINGGNRNAPLSASDGNGTIAQHIDRIRATQADRANAFLSSAGGQATPGGPEVSATGQAADFTSSRIVALLPPEKLHAYYARAKAAVEGQTATERHTISRQFDDTKAALMSGVDPANTSVTPGRIRAAYPPDQAEPMVRTLEIARQAGQEFKLVEFGSPSEVMAAQSRLMGAKLEAETDENFRQRAEVAAHFQTALRDRERRLREDPGAYVQRSPAYQAMQARLTADDPTATARLIDTSLAEQERLGVPSYERRALPKAQIADLARRITGTDPSKADMGKEIEGLQQAYGDQWQTVYGQLVRDGKLPGEYQVLAAMTEPGQRVARDMLQRGLSLVAGKGGWDALRSGQEAGTAKQIEEAISSDLSDFRKATSSNSGNERAYEAVHNAAKVLAYQYTRSGMSVSNATTEAVKGVLREKYEVVGMMVFPKGRGAAVGEATRMVQAGLGAGMLEMPPATAETANLTEQARQDAWMSAVKRGEWAPNEGMTGLVLTAQLFNGARLPVRMSDGKPVEVLFDALPSMGNNLRPAEVDRSRAAPFRAPGGDALGVLGGGTR